MRRVLGPVLVALLAGCTGLSGGGPVGPLDSTSTNGVAQRQQDGLTLRLESSRDELAPGESIGFGVTLRNDRSEAAEILTQECFATLDILASVAVEPRGRDWTGAAGRFKQFALTQGLGPGGVPVTDPIEITARSDTCPPSSDYKALLGPGEEVTATFHWDGSLVAGVAAAPGAVTIRTSVGYDPEPPPSYPPDYTGPRGIWVPVGPSIQLETTLSVNGAAQSTLTPGQAIDAALGDARFREFVESQPGGTCELVNLYLYDMQGSSIFPAGPAWMVEYLCETGVPRHFVIAAIDPRSGDVKKVDICADPCAR